MKNEVARNRTFVGPTPLSMLVSGESANIRKQFADPIVGEADIQTFGVVWMLCPISQAKTARKLIMTAILNQLASWDFRFHEKLKQLQYQLVLLVEKPPNEVCPLRKSMVAKLLDMSDLELDADSQWTDVPRKIKIIFVAELAVVKDTGNTCSVAAQVFVSQQATSN